MKSHPEPINIDDDVSDNDSDGVTQQLKELDVRNKYMQHIRVPTSKYFIINIAIELATDDYLTVNGVSGNHTSHGYTLARMRKEERLLQMGPTVAKQDDQYDYESNE